MLRALSRVGAASFCPVIANADASGSPHTDGAINEAYRALFSLRFQHSARQLENYRELTNADEQRRRFDADAARRAADDMPVIAVAPNDELLEKLNSNLQEVRARGGELSPPFPPGCSRTVSGSRASTVKARTKSTWASGPTHPVWA